MFHTMTGLARMCALSTLAAGATGAAFAATEIELDGHRIRFERTGVDIASAALESMPSSLITVTRIGGSSPIYTERSSLIPGCEGVPTISLIAGRYAALCGHLGGRHYTYRVFRIGGSGPEVATLDAFDVAAPLLVDGQGGIMTRVARRDQFPGELVGPVYFPYVYALHADASTFGFAPTFGEGAKRHYVHVYAWHKANDGLALMLPAMLAALMATQDRALICKEVAQWKSGTAANGGDVVALENTIRQWSAKLPAIGYPAFDVTRCSG